MPCHNSRPLELVRAVILSVAFALSLGLGARVEAQEAKARKVVLVELFTSQGCDLCPTAEALIGSLGELGYGSDRVVPLALHVDYFNEPWKDPFSDPLYSRRQWEYSRIYNEKNGLNKADYLYFTPLVLVDGTYPFMGAAPDGKDKLRQMIEQALRERPAVGLDLSWEESPEGGSGRRTLNVTVSSLGRPSSGREILIGVATVEDGVSTKVASGELAGKTYQAHNAARRLAMLNANPRSGQPANLEVPITLEKEWNPDRCGVVVFAQEERTGHILQAAALPWASAREGSARRR